MERADGEVDDQFFATARQSGWIDIRSDLTPGSDIYQMKINHVNSEWFQLLRFFGGIDLEGGEWTGRGEAQFAHVSALKPASVPCSSLLPEADQLHSPVVVSYKRAATPVVSYQRLQSP